MAKKKTAPPNKKQARKQQPKARAAKQPRGSMAAPTPHSEREVGAKPQLVTAKPLTDAKVIKKKADAARGPEAPIPPAPLVVDDKADSKPVQPNSGEPAPSASEEPPKPQPTVPQIAQKQKPAHSGAAPASVSTKPTPAVTVDTASTGRAQPKPNRRRLARNAAALAIVAVVAALGFWAIQKRDEAAMTANQRLIKEVSQKVVLPTDEVPSVSTVTDPSKVNQQFLEKTKKGDKVLVYFQAAEAVVFRPSTGQVVNMGPLSAPSPRVWLRAGSAKADIPKIGRETNAGGDFAVISNDASVSQNYQHTIVIDLAGNRPDIAKRLALQLHATVGQLPDNEDKPDADLLVIVGSDNNRP